MPPVILHKDQKFYNHDKRKIFWENSRLLMLLAMILSDLLCINGSIFLATSLWTFVRSDFVFNYYLSLSLPVSGIFLMINLLTGMYPGIGVGPVDELRRLTINTTLGALALMGISFYVRSISFWSRAILGLTWIFLLISAPLLRKAFRRLALQIGIWGIPVIIVGEGLGPERIFDSLKRNPLLGFWPVLCIQTNSLQDIFPSSGSDHADDWDGKTLFQDIEIVIIVPQIAPLGAVKNVLLDRSHRFKRIIVMFDEAMLGSVWFTPLHMIEQLGLELTHPLIDPTQKIIKRIIDITLSLVGLPLLLPIFAGIALAIKLESPGPVFYTQKRIGLDGQEINLWKFRSMYNNADDILKTFLELNQESRDEWDQNFKLKQDPRVTRVGTFLRRFSLDELPQCWNVIKGEMSLIGPRPIVKEEIPLYEDNFEIYKQVLPGMTGMWQISGRNNLTYKQRVGMDVYYYVQNWSIWLDAHILLHTILAVLQGNGAY